MTASAKLGVGLIILGAGLATLGRAAGQPFVGAAVAVFGAAAIVGGIDSIITRRHRTGRRGSSDLPREHAGAAAVVFGLTFILVGLVLAVAGSASALGLADGLWSWVTDNVGPIAIIGGVWICALGAATMLSRWTYMEQSTSWWQRVPGMAVGLLVVAMGVVVVAMGRSLAADPPASDELLETVADTFLGWLGLD